MSLVQFTTQQTYPSSLLHIILKDFLTKNKLQSMPDNSKNTLQSYKLCKALGRQRKITFHAH